MWSSNATLTLVMQAAGMTASIDVTGLAACCTSYVTGDAFYEATANETAGSSEHWLKLGVGTGETILDALRTMIRRPQVFICAQALGSTLAPMRQSGGLTTICVLSMSLPLERIMWNRPMYLPTGRSGV